MKILVPLLVLATVIMNIPSASGLKCVQCRDPGSSQEMNDLMKGQPLCSKSEEQVCPADSVCSWNSNPATGLVKSCIAKSAAPSLGCPVNIGDTVICYCEENLCNKDRTTAEASGKDGNEGGGGDSVTNPKGKKNSATSFGLSSSWVGILIISLGLLFRQLHLFDN